MKNQNKILKRNRKNNNDRPARIAIIGKPNVGKSSMFNALCGRKLAIVNDAPGVTRDNKIYPAKLYDYEFEIVDTAGIDDFSLWDKKDICLDSPHSTKNIDKSSIEEMSNPLEKSAHGKTIKGIMSADIIIFMIDAKYGISYIDCELASFLRKTNKQFILVANKAESQINLDNELLYKMHMPEPLMMSVAHRIGFHELYDEIVHMRNQLYLKDTEIKNKDYNDDATENEFDASSEEDEHEFAGDCKEDGASHSEGKSNTGHIDSRKKSNDAIAFVGRPNVGKSTLFNRIVGYERTIVSNIPGTTRDAISENIILNDIDYSVIDTAGMRKKNKIMDDIEWQSIGQSIAAIRRASIVALMIDGCDGLTNQDRKILHAAINEGKSIIIIINKIDLVDDINSVENMIISELENFNIYSPPIIMISATESANLEPLINAINLSQSTHSRVLPTRALNKWLEAITQEHMPPLAGHNQRPIKLKYIVQKAVRPLTFDLFTNYIVPDSYIRFLKKSLINRFQLYGASIRINIKKSANPYANSKPNLKSSSSSRPRYKSGAKIASKPRSKVNLKSNHKLSRAKSSR